MSKSQVINPEEEEQRNVHNRLGEGKKLKYTGMHLHLFSAEGINK